MLQNTAQFIFFFIATAILYYLIPGKARKIYLCLVNLFYAYLIGGVSTIAIILVVTFVTYLTAIYLEKIPEAKRLLRKMVVAVFCVFVVGVLFFGKYVNLFLQICGVFLRREFAPISLITMVGISYYALSVISYMVDIYRGKDQADRNFIDMFIWTTLFSKIIAGPIERHNSFKNQMDKVVSVKFDSERIKRGFLIAAWGYFEKIIIADRAGMIVDNAFLYIDDRHGVELLIAALLYAIQVYMDFAGYSHIALGVSHIFGIKITNNFDRPFFATSVTELWRRWHISLSSWLKDYIYIPLGGSRKGKVRQYINLVLTFVISGIWHGAALSYAFWGFINGIYQIIEKFIKDTFKPNIPSSYDLCRRIGTFLLFSFSTIFFRAPSLRTGIRFVKQMFDTFNPWVLYDGTLYGLGLEQRDWNILILAIIVLFLVETIQERKISVYNLLQQQPLVMRWICYFAIIFVLLVYGVYGSQYDSGNFIYFKF